MKAWNFLFNGLSIFLELFRFDSAFFISCFASLDTFLSSLDNIFKSGYTSSLSLFPKIKFKIGYLETVTGKVLLFTSGKPEVNTGLLKYRPGTNTCLFRIWNNKYCERDFFQAVKILFSIGNGLFCFTFCWAYLF